MTFLVIDLNAHTESDKLSTPTLQSGPARHKFPLPRPGGTLTIFPYKLRQKNFSRPGGAPTSTAPPGYTYAVQCITTISQLSKLCKRIEY